MPQTVLFNTRIRKSAFKYSMEIIVHNHQTLTSPGDVHGMYSTPVWEIEIQSALLEQAEFAESLHTDANFAVSEGHHSQLRSGFVGSGIVKQFLNESQRDWLLDLVLDHPTVRPRFVMPRKHYTEKSNWFATVLRDLPGYYMEPHLDNSHIMIQMIVNLLQDNETATDFYLFDKRDPVYQAPKQKNRGVIFVNTPGSIHTINNIQQPRWILYAGVLI